MAVTAADVKNLREITGAGMMDCKKALAETNGDMDKAIEFLREKGLAASAKKAGRIAAEGIVKSLVEGNKGVLVEVNSETDFVAKNEKFQDFVSNVCKQVVASNAKDVEELKAEKWNLDETKTLAEELSSQIAIIGENIQIRRFTRIEENEGLLVSYIHGGGRIGVLLDAKVSNKTAEIEAALTDVAMQIAAMNPQYVSIDEVPQETKDKEKAILLSQALNENNELPENKRKKPEIIERIVDGRLDKELKQISLLQQTFVKDSELTVAKYLEKVSKENNSDISIVQFVRYETGEGIEKKSDDFAAEVAAQMGM